MQKEKNKPRHGLDRLKKASDMLPHSWISESMRMLGIANNIIEIFENSMPSWKTNLFSDGKLLGTVKIKRGIFQGDSFSPLMFVMALIPITHVLRSTQMGYQIEKNGPTINHTLFMDDLKLFGKNENEIDSLVKTVEQCSNDICMKFGVAKCAVVNMKRGKRHSAREIKLPSGEEMREPNPEGYKYLGILELEVILCKEMRTKVKKEYTRRILLLLKSQLNGRNLFSAINSWAVAVVRYSAAFINWPRNEMRELDRNTRKLLVKYGALHPKSNVQRVYMKRKVGGRGLISVEECVASEIRNIHHYLVNSQEVLLKAVVKEHKLDDRVIEEKDEYNRRVESEKEEAISRMKLHGQFEENTKESKSEESWTWLRKGTLKRETESLIMAAQEQALNTNSVKRNIYKMDVSDKCRLCGKKTESVTHIVSACEVIANKGYKRRHDKVCLNLHWQLCKKYGFPVADRWYRHEPEGAIENDRAKILWDFMVQCDIQIEHRKPDIIVIDKKDKMCKIIDVACPGDHNLVEKRNEKMNRYADLRLEIARMWNIKTIVVPIIIGALGSIPKDIHKFLKLLDIDYDLNILQLSVLLGTANILRKVLAMQ